MLIQGKILSYGDDLSEVIEIRKKVFIDELGYSSEMIFDDIDQFAMYVIVYEEDPNWKEKKSNVKKAVATGRIYYDGSTCEIGQVAVLKEYRRKQYGDFTVRMLLNKAFISGVNTVSLISPWNTVEFFKTIGFRVTDESKSSEDLQQYAMEIKSNEVITQCKKK